MASPVAHGFAGVALAWLVRYGPLGTRVEAAEHDRPRRLRQLTAVLVAAVAADFDFLPGFLVGDPAGFHRGPAHSLTAAVAFGVLAALVAGRLGFGAPRRFGLFMGVVFATHMPIDLLTSDYGEPHGLPLFWPFVTANVTSPIHVFVFIRHTGDDSGLLAELFSVHNAWAVLREALIMGPLLAAARLAAKSSKTST